MLPVLLPLALFICALVFVAYIKTGNAIRVFRWVAESPDRTLRRLAAVSLVPSIIMTISLSIRGLPLPIALAIGGLLNLGVVVSGAGVLGVEGALIESGSEGIVRVAQHLPPKTTALGRAVAIAIGACVVLGATGLCWWASQA